MEPFTISTHSWKTLKPIRKNSDQSENAEDPSKTLPSVTQTVDFSTFSPATNDSQTISVPPTDIKATLVNQQTLDSSVLGRRYAAGAAARNLNRDAGFSFNDPNIATSFSSLSRISIDQPLEDNTNDPRRTATDHFTIENQTLDSGVWQAQQEALRQSDPNKDDDEGTFDER